MYEKRSPERIDRIISLIYTIWKEKDKDDLRFFQFINWLEHSYSKQHGYVGKIELFHKGNHNIPYTVIDLFNLEDDKFERFLIELVENKNL